MYVCVTKVINIEEYQNTLLQLLYASHLHLINNTDSYTLDLIHDVLWLINESTI